MVIPEKHPVRLLVLFALLAGCGGDRPPPVEPALVQRSAASVQTPSPAEATAGPVVEAEALELSAGVRAAMTRTLTAALAEFDLQPDVPMRTLQSFFRQVEAQQAVRPEDRADRPRTVQP